MNPIISKQKSAAKALVSANLILQKNDQILLGLRHNTGHGDNYYNLVVGKVDIGETIDEAVIREAKEEIGITLREDHLSFFMLMQTLNVADPYDTALHAFFLCKNWEGDIVNQEPGKCAHLDFFPLKQLPSNTSYYTQKVLHYLTHPSEHKYYQYLEQVI